MALNKNVEVFDEAMSFQIGWPPPKKVFFRHGRDPHSLDELREHRDELKKRIAELAEQDQHRD